MSKTNSPHPSSKKTVREEVLHRAKGLNREDLLEFIISECEQAPEFLDSFQIRFAGINRENPRPNYKKMVGRAIETATQNGKQGHIAEVFLEEVLEKLEKRLAVLTSQNAYEETFEICYLILKELPSQLELISENTFEVEGSISLAAQNMGELLSGQATLTLKNQFAFKAISLFGEKDIRTWGYDDYLWEGFMALDLSQDNEKALFQQLDKIINEIHKTNSNWDIEQWIKRKQELLIKLGRENESEAFLISFIHLPVIRRSLVKQEREAGRLHKAKMLIREVMQLENEKGFRSSKREWRIQLLEIAQEEDDKLDIRSHARVLFEEGHWDLKYYDILRSTFTAEQWKVEVEKFIQKLSRNGQIVLVHRAAAIFKEEDYKDRLLALLQANPSQYQLLKEYYPPLEQDHSEEVLQLFREAIETYVATHPSRPHYYQLVNMLKHLCQLKGGLKVQDELLTHFRVLYKRRPTMMKILGNAFE